MRIDACRIWEEGGWKEAAEAARDHFTDALFRRGDFRAIVDRGWLKDWLDLHRFEPNGAVYRYPVKSNRDGKPEIFGWHTEIRRQHAKLRRGKK